MVQTLPRLSGPPEKDLAELITLEFALWLQRDEVFDMLVKDMNDDSIRKTKSPLGDLR
jgi:hypothetical protein